MPLKKNRGLTDVLNRIILNTGGNGTSPGVEDTRLPCLIGKKDAGEFIGKVEATPEKELGNISVPDMIVKILHNYNPEVLRAFLDRQQGDVRFSREGPGDYRFSILQDYSFITESHIL